MLKSKIKALLAIVSVCALVFMAGCTGTPTKETKERSNTSSSSKSDSTYKVGETAEFKTLKITADEIKLGEGSTYFEPESGKVFVGVHFTIENISDEDQAISSMLLFEAYADDVKCSYSLSAMMAFDSQTLDGTISPGKKMEGYYALEVAEATEKIELKVQASWLSSSKATFAFDMPAA